MSNVVTDFHNFRNLYSSTDLFGLFGMCFSRYNFDRNIMYLDQSTLLICYYDIDRLGSIRKVDRDNRSSYVFAYLRATCQSRIKKLSNRIVQFHRLYQYTSKRVYR